MTNKKSANPRALLTPAALHILLALADEERHGYGIQSEVEERTGGQLNLGPATLYEAIHRMVGSGWIRESARKGEGDDGRSNRRKYYRLAREGRRQMEAELARLDEIVRYARSKSLLPNIPRTM